MKLLALISMLVGVSVCASASTTWVLSNDVTFSDGGVATGWFTVDSTFDALTAWSLVVTGSPLGRSDFDYESSLANSNYTGITTTHVNVFNATQFLFLTLASPMTAGGTINFVTGGSSLDCPGCGTLTGGSISPAPEPGSLLLAAFGLAALLAYRKRRLLNA